MYPNNAEASCFAGVRAFRGNDNATWARFEKIHEATSSGENDDVVEAISLMFHGGDPTGTYRPFTKGGFVDQVAQFPGAIVGSGDTGFYMGNPPPAEASTVSPHRVYWMPEGPDRGSPEEPQLWNWTGGVYIGPGGPYALIGGYTDMAYRYMVRPFPDRQRRISVSDHEWEWFFGAVTSASLPQGAVLGDEVYGPMVLRSLFICEGRIPEVDI